MENVEIAKRWFDEVWGASRSEKAIDELMARDAQVFGIRSDGPIDRQSFKEVWTLYTKAFPDMSIRVVDTMSQGDRIAYRAVVDGHYKRQVFTFEGNGIVKIHNGAIVESHETWDFYGLLSQLGVVGADALQNLLQKCAASEGH